MDLSGNLLTALRCPRCGSRVGATATEIRCTSCGDAHPIEPSGRLDLRLRRPKDATLTVQVGLEPLATDDERVQPLRAEPHPQVDFAGMDVPEHLSATMLSHVPAAPRSGALALDLGCGWGVHRSVCERAGYEWVGVDFFEPAAPIAADAHALPFADDAFDFVLTIAVLEHLRHPILAMREAARVLAPGRTMLGTVAFLEPFHGDSHYHHTHLGVLNTLDAAGLDVVVVAPHLDWDVVRAQATMGLLPGAGGRVRERLVTTISRAIARTWRRAGRDDAIRARNHAGAFTFIARSRRA